MYWLADAFDQIFSLLVAVAIIFILSTHIFEVMVTLYIIGALVAAAIMGYTVLKRRMMARKVDNECWSEG